MAEEHIKPLRNPTQYVLGELADMMGLEQDGTVKNIPVANLPEVAAKTESTPAAVSLTLMNRQISAAGFKSSPANSKTPKLDESRENSQQSKNKQGEASYPALATAEDLWANASINPQDLLHNFQGLETGAGGAISDMSIYRSITPNDTPESSKDGNSEPNSDITEGLDLNINLDIFDSDWVPYGPGVGDELLDLSKINVNPDDDWPQDEESSQWFSWGDYADANMQSKPLDMGFDTSMFSMIEK